MVNNENNPLEKIIIDKGLYKGIWTILHNYPLSTIFGIEKDQLWKQAEERKNVTNEIQKLNEEIEILKENLKVVDEKVKSIEEIKSLVENMKDKLQNLSTSSMDIYSRIDFVEGSIYAAGFIAPFLTYRSLLSQYIKLTEIKYSPKNAGEARMMQSMKRESVVRFNRRRRRGIPLMALTYLAIWNRSNFKNIFKGFNFDGAFSPVEENISE